MDERWLVSLLIGIDGNCSISSGEKAELDPKERLCVFGDSALQPPMLMAATVIAVSSLFRIAESEFLKITGFCLENKQL